MNLVNTLILSAAIIIAGFLIGGRYTVAGGAGGTYAFDRFTGDRK